jgi:hypothetical protein
MCIKEMPNKVLNKTLNPARKFIKRSKNRQQRFSQQCAPLIG